LEVGGGNIQIENNYALLGRNSGGSSSNLIGLNTGGDVSVGGNNNNDIVFNSGGTERFRVNVTGVGIGTTTPQSKLDIYGGVSIGTSYAGITAAPTNGLIVQGNVGIGTSAPAANVKADINGMVKVAGTGSEPCGAAQVGSMRYNPTGNYFELCSYP
jgi:hypothetical protein